MRIWKTKFFAVVAVCRRASLSLSFSDLFLLLPPLHHHPNKQNSSTPTPTATTTLASKLFSTAGFALVAVSGIALAKPKVEALPHGAPRSRSRRRRSSFS